MSQISLYIDEDAMDQLLVQGLRARDVDVTTVGEARTTGISDPEQLILATLQGRSIYTYNAGDFCRLHSIYMAEARTHAGIIIGSQQQNSLGEILRGLMKLIATKSGEEMVNQLIFLRNYID